MVKRLFNTTKDNIVFVADLSIGTEPGTWFSEPLVEEINGAKIYGKDRRVLFFTSDVRDVIRNFQKDTSYFKQFGFDFERFNDVFHFAAIVGGRLKIDGDPMMVAQDLSIDAEFFQWVCTNKPDRVLYPSSSAAYPVSKQTEGSAIALRESDIDFNNMGQPDMTTGEYLAHIAAKHYDVHITCIRPFSGYGEDQDLSYPVPAIALRAAYKEAPFEVWGSGHQGRDFVHIDDVIDCILLAMDKIHDGTAINIGMGKLTTFREIIGLFTKFAGYSPEIKPLLDKPVGVHSRYCNMDFVKETLGWEAKISTEEGMRRVYQKALERAKAGVTNG